MGSLNDMHMREKKIVFNWSAVHVYVFKINKADWENILFCPHCCKANFPTAFDRDNLYFSHTSEFVVTSFHFECLRISWAVLMQLLWLTMRFSDQDERDLEAFRGHSFMLLLSLLGLLSKLFYTQTKFSFENKQREKYFTSPYPLSILSRGAEVVDVTWIRKHAHFDIENRKTSSASCPDLQ